MVQDLSFQYTDQELVRGCIQNNRLAQKEMYERLASRMYSVCLRYVNDKEMARDVLHDGFITLFSKLETFRGDGSFEGWARRIFVTTALMHLRKVDVLKRWEEVEVMNIPVEAMEDERLDAARLTQLLGTMPPGFRTVFNLFAIEGYSHQEIARELNITESGSRSQLSRARIWLKERLAGLE